VTLFTSGGLGLGLVILALVSRIWSCLHHWFRLHLPRETVACKCCPYVPFIRRSHRSRFVPPDLPAFADICPSADKKLFSVVIRDSDHVLHKLLPPLSTASQSYNLRERKHDYLLPLRTGHLFDHNFIQRMLYLDVY